MGNPYEAATAFGPIEPARQPGAAAAAEIHESARVLLYTEVGCRFCAAAKALLALRGFAFEEIDVTDDLAARQGLFERGGMATLAQLFVDGRLVGGFDEIRDLDRTGVLGHLLAADS